MGKDTFLVFQSLLVYAWFTLVPVDSDIRQNVLRSARADLFFVFFYKCTTVSMSGFIHM